MKSLRLLSVAIIATGALTVSACGNSGASQNSSENAFTIVTSTNVYANIAQSIAGETVEVTPIINDATTDPHSYEASSQDQLTLSEADLVIANGGGYDAFITTMLEAIDEDPHVIDVVSISGLEGSEELNNEPHDHAGESEDAHEAEETASAGGETHSEHDHAHDDETAESDHGSEDEHTHGEFNEHVWYSVPTMVKLVDELEKELTEQLPDQASSISANADDYRDRLQGVSNQIADVKQSAEGKKSAATESVPLWLFADMGIDNVTPSGFLEAVEEGNDVSPSVLHEAQEQISNKEVDIFVYNTQATNDQAEVLKKQAEEAGIPVVDMTETIPEDTDYVDWMSGYVNDVKSALS